MFNFNKEYEEAVAHIAEFAPSLVEIRGATKYFVWAEDIVNLLAFIYGKHPDDVIEDLTDQVKVQQGYESEDDE